MKKVGKKIISILLIAACVVNSSPVGVLAAMISTNSADVKNSVTVVKDKDGKDVSGESLTNQGDIKVVKSVQPRVVNGNVVEGEYTISFNITGKSYETQTSSPLYSIVVFDRSDSMSWAKDKWSNAKLAAIRYSQILNDGKNKFAVINFTDTATVKRNGKFTTASITEDELGKMAPGTAYYPPLNAANNIIKNNKAEIEANNAKVVILFVSDGHPQGLKNLFKEVMTTKIKKDDILTDDTFLINLKNKATIYTVGYELQADGDWAEADEAVLRNLSTDKSNFINTKVESLVPSLEKLANELKKSPVATNAKLTEVLSEEFELIPGESATKDLADIDENGQTITYNIRVKDEYRSMADGVYETNNKSQTKITVGNKTLAVVDKSPSIYWERPSVKYSVKYHYQNLQKDGYVDGNTISDIDAKLGDIISKDTKKPSTNSTYGEIGKQDGFAINNNLSKSVKLDKNNKTLDIYYDRASFDYRVEYYYDGTKEFTKTYENKTFGEVINTYEPRLKAGYKLDKVEGSPLTISSKEDNNVIKVYYVKRTDLKYRVEHYYDNNLDNSKTDPFSNMTFGEEINEFTKKEIDGYKYCRVENLPLTISEDEEVNVIKAYYEKRTDLKYKVNYYYDGVKEFTKTYENKTFGEVINTYEPRLKTGYKLDKVEGAPLVITTKENNNVIDVYYVKEVKDIKEEAIEMPHTNVNGFKLNHIHQFLLMNIVLLSLFIVMIRRRYE